MREDDQKLTQSKTPKPPSRTDGWPEDTGAPPTPLEKGWFSNNSYQPSQERK